MRCDERHFVGSGRKTALAAPSTRIAARSANVHASQKNLATAARGGALEQRSNHRFRAFVEKASGGPADGAVGLARQRFLPLARCQVATRDEASVSLPTLRGD